MAAAAITVTNPYLMSIVPTAPLRWVEVVTVSVELDVAEVVPGVVKVAVAKNAAHAARVSVGATALEAVVPWP